MKKFISILLSSCILFAFVGCSDKTVKTPTDANITAGDVSTVPEQTEAATVVFKAVADDSPAIYAVTSTDSPAVGEEIVIDFRLCNVSLFSSIDLRLNYDAEAFDVRNVGNCKIEDAASEINIKDGNIIFASYVMRTAEAQDVSLFKLAVTPKAGATGMQTIRVNALSLLVALDADGNATTDCASSLKTSDITLLVK